MLEQDITQIRKERHSKTQEDFTPDNVLDIMFDDKHDLYSDFDKTFLDPSAGNGNIILYLLRHRLSRCQCVEEVEKACSTIYGIELMPDNVDECKSRIYDLIQDYGFNCNKKIKDIIDANIVCSDFFEWDIDNWRPLKQNKSCAKEISLFDL